MGKLKKRRRRLIKSVSVALLSLLMVKGMDINAVAASGDDVWSARELVASYDMTYEGGYLIDNSTYGNDAEVVGFSEGDFVREGGDDVLQFVGNNNEYIKIPAGLIQKESFAIEATFKTNRVENSWLWCLGTYVQGTGSNYVFVSPAFSDNTLRSGIKDSSNETLFSGAGSINYNEYNTVLVEFDNGNMTLSLNGKVKSSMATSYSIQQILRNGSASDFCGYIGRSLYSADPAFYGTLTQFDVYAEVIDDSDEGRLKEDLRKLSVPEVVMEELTLPTKGSINNSSITWTSSHPALISEEGNVSLPGESTFVTLTAKGTYQSETMERTFTVKVLGLDELLESALLIPYTITPDYELPKTIAGMGITWNSSDSERMKDGKIQAPKTGISEEFKLTASLMTEGYTAKQTYNVQVLGEDYTYLLGYTRNGSVDGGIRVGNSLHLAYSEDGKSFEALNSNYGVLFAKADYSGGAAGVTQTLEEPYMFRMKDGSFGVVAVKADVNGNVNAAGYMMFFTSEDLIQYTDAALLEIHPGEHMYNLTCEYDGAADCYRIGWNTADGSQYYCTTEDFETFTEPEAGIAFEAVSVSNANISNSIPENIIYLTKEEGEKVYNKLCRYRNVGVEDALVVLEIGEELDLEDVRVDAVYNDGSTYAKRVKWNQKQIEAIDTTVPGTYTVEGEIIQEVYPFPMMISRADPNILYYEGMYYFIATDDKYADQYDIYIRGSETIAGLADGGLVAGSDRVHINDHLIWNGSSTYIQDANGNSIVNPHQGIHWAPELHAINDELYCFFSMRPHNNVGGRYLPQSYIAKLKTGGDPLKAEDWEEPIRVMKEDGSPLVDENEGISLDMTYFVVDDVPYVCWSQRNFDNGEHPGLYVAKADEYEPWYLASEPKRLSEDSFSWERDGCNEGAYVVVNGDTVYMVFAANGVGPQYSTGMMTAKVGDDLSDPSVWTKSNYPWMHNGVFAGQSGLGHNSFFTDEYGDMYNVYHANGSNDRSSTIVPLRFRADGSPVLDIKPEEDVNPAYKKVKAVITVTDGSEPEPLPYEDVADTDWFYEAVAYTYYENLMTGMDKTHFGPYGQLSRAQFALILYRMEGEEPVNTDKSFGDIAGDEWYGPAVLWAAEHGIVTGYQDGNFGPADMITREQMAVMMYRYAKYLGQEVTADADLSKFADEASVSAFASEAMKWANGNGIITGKENGTMLDPQGNTARSEAAVIIQRFMN